MKVGDYELQHLETCALRLRKLANQTICLSSENSFRTWYTLDLSLVWFIMSEEKLGLE